MWGHWTRPLFALALVGGIASAAAAYLVALVATGPSSFGVRFALISVSLLALVARLTPVPVADYWFAYLATAAVLIAIRPSRPLPSR